MIVLFARGKYRSGRPDDLGKLVVMFPDIKRLISLQPGVLDFLAETFRYGQAPHEYGLEFFDLGSSDVLPPDDFTIQKTLQLLRQEKSTLLYCSTGVDRTGFMVAVYRMQVQGWTFERAHREWVQMGRHFWVFWWKWKLKEYEIKTPSKEELNGRQ